MKCPMTFGVTCEDRAEECRKNCAWLMENDNGNKACAIAVIAAGYGMAYPGNHVECGGKE